MGGFVSKVVSPLSSIITTPNISASQTPPQLQNINTNPSDPTTNAANDQGINDLLVSNTRKGIAANILTGNKGLTQNANIGRKLLLGQ